MGRDRSPGRLGFRPQVTWTNSFWPIHTDLAYYAQTVAQGESVHARPGGAVLDGIKVDGVARSHALHLHSAASGISVPRARQSERCLLTVLLGCEPLQVVYPVVLSVPADVINVHVTGVQPGVLQGDAIPLLAQEGLGNRPVHPHALAVDADLPAA